MTYQIGPNSHTIVLLRMSSYCMFFFLETPIAGISNWYRPHPVADGESITLYEHKPGNTQHHGDPIADVFSVIVRRNNCIMAVADGVNWGIKPRLAARCAIHGVMEHLNLSLFGHQSTAPQSVQDVFHCILRSFHNGQKLIIKHGGTTTTLCVAVIVELQEPKGAARWGLCVVSVGDSLCFIWRNEVQMVYEVTSAMHVGRERNPRDSGGCLGCNLGDQPDLSNLLCCFVPIADNDVVFIVSDGISDNTDPVLLKEALAEGQPLSPGDPNSAEDNPKGGPIPGLTGVNLPIINPYQRQDLILMKLTNLLKTKLKSLKMPLHAQDVKDAIINYVIDATETKREYLEHCWTELEKPDILMAERRANERKIAQHLKQLPGKLDHATIAAYKVGELLPRMGEFGNNPTHSFVMKKAEPKMKKGKHHSATGGSVFYGSAVSGGSDIKVGLGSLQKSLSMDSSKEEIHLKRKQTFLKTSSIVERPIRDSEVDATAVEEEVRSAGIGTSCIL